MAREQLTLPYEPQHRAAERWERVLARFVDIVDELGRKEVVYYCGTDRGALDDALHERDRKSPRLKWLVTVLEMAAGPDQEDAREMAVGLLEILADTLGYELRACKPRTPQEELDAFKQAMAAELGHAALERVAKRARGGR